MSLVRRADIQGLRAVAVLLVVVFHTGVALPGGFTGVDVFFAISGFVITATLVAEIESTGRISLPRFYLRRMKRLLPALALLVIVVADAGMLLGPAAATHLSGMTGIFASFFAANVYLNSLHTGYFAVSTQLDPLLHTWTLAVEEQFYLVFPAVLIGAWSIGARRGRARLAALIALAVAGEASLLFALHHANAAGVGVGYYGSPARAWEFAAGSLTALATPLWQRLPRRVAAALAAVGLAGIVAMSFGEKLSLPLIPVAAACALLAAGVVPNHLSTVLGVRPLTWIGDLSYSLYLWHWPFIVFAIALLPDSSVAAPAAAAASLLPAWLSYRYVENPIRHEPRLLGRRAFALAAICMLVPASIAFGTTRMPQYTDVSYGGRLHADVSRGCEAWTAYVSPARARCTWAAAHSRGTVVLIGDSNAGHFTEPFVAAAQEAGYDATVAAPSGCPFIPLQIHSANMAYTDCNRFNVETLPALVRQRPSLVVIAERTDVYLTRSDFTLHGNAASPASRARVWLAASKSEIGALNRAGIPVVVIDPVPEMDKTVVGCAVILVLTNTCGGSVSRAASDRKLASTREVDTEAIAGKRAWLVSFEDQFCTRTRCSSSRHGATLYRDEYHLSVEGAETLTPRFASDVISRARGWRPVDSRKV
jgi:peptidoglycan/LPS O-acetylase OafA/YrhL